jgi:predicted ATPase
MELLEREPLRAALAARVAEAAQGRGSLVLVIGEAGIGKSALVRDVCEAHAGRIRVLGGACEALRTPRPLGPLRDIARTAGGALARLVAEDAPRHRMFTALLDVLEAAPAMVVLEDVHWADDATLDLLLFLGRRIVDTRGVVVATLRDEEVDRDHRLRVVLGDLATAPAVVRLPVPPLSRPAVGARGAEPPRDPRRL